MAPADTLVCDTAQVAAWQSDPAFAYSRELIAPEINVLEWFSRWFGKLLDKIFGNTLVAEYSEDDIDMHCRSYPGIGHLVCIQASGTVHAFGARVPCPIQWGRIPSMEWILRKELPMRLPGRIIGRAVRLLYLQTLKQLSDGKRIDWQLYKTPTQYIYEVRLPASRQMTNHFLPVRYGNFEATEAFFHAMRDLQKEVGERRGGMKGEFIVL